MATQMATQTSGREEIITMLHPMSKEQIMGLLADAAVRSPEIKESIEELANRSRTHRKIFVRGLPWELTSEKLVAALEAKFGPVEEGAVIMDRHSGRSKGFGFVTFKKRSDAQKSLEANNDSLMFGRQIMVKLAATPITMDNMYNGSKRRRFDGAAGRPPHMNVDAVDVAQRRLFVRGLAFATTTETFLQVFSQYGEIEEGTVVPDKAKSDGSSKGFGFVTFKTREAAIAALTEPVKEIDGRRTTACFAARGADTQGPNQAFGRSQFGMQQQARGVAGNMGRAYGGYNPMNPGIAAGVGAAYGGSGGAGYGATYGGAGFSPSSSAAVGAGYAGAMGGAMGDASKSESYFGDAAANAYARFPPQQQSPFAGRGGYSGYNR